MKETVAKRRDKPDRDPKAEKSKEPGHGPQDVEMPEEEAANAVKLPGELDSVTLDGKQMWNVFNLPEESGPIGFGGCFCCEAWRQLFPRT